MRFVLVHKVVSYLMVLASTLSLFASGELHPLTPLVFLLGTLGSWWAEPARNAPGASERLWTLGTLGLFAFLGLRTVQGEPALLQGVYFLLCLTLNKLFNRRSSRDYLQLYVLSFMLLVASTAIDADVTYGVQFALYVVFGTWTLILFHLKREMEDNYLLKYGDSLQGRPVQVERVLNSRKLVGPRFLLATSAISLVVFLGSTLVFVFFPRIGFGLFFKKQRPGIMMSGFSDKVELGRFGTVKDDPTVVMRIEFPGEGRPAAEPRYLRGLSLDHYDGTTWTKSRPQKEKARRGDGGVHVLRPELGLAGREVVQAVYLEPMETRVLFGLSPLHAVAFQDPYIKVPMPGQVRSIQTDAEGDAHYEQTDEIAFRYYAYSAKPEGRPQSWDQPLGAYRAALQAAGEDASRYLQLPAGLEPRVAELAARLVGDAATVGQAVDRVTAHLSTDYTYTLDLERDSTLPPLEDFLFVQRRGHCEYFATALVVLLRTQGIAARNVNGFLGGEWNAFGQYLAMRQGDAHSWTEVWMPDGHWVTRDATPSGVDRMASVGLMQSLAAWTDALRMRWYKYVIEYDLNRQVGVFESVGRALKDLFSGLRGGEGSGAQRTRDRTGPLPQGLIIGVLVAAGLLVVVWWWRRRRAATATGLTRHPGEAAAELYRLCISTYARLGFTRSEHTTAREWVAALEARGAPQPDLAREVVGLYESERFGAAPPNPRVRARLRAALANLTQTPSESRP
jgi:transglutaminase-like putative cysteine protease